MLGVQADWRPSRLPIWESERTIRGPVLRLWAPIYVLVRLSGPPGVRRRGGRRGGGGEAKLRGVAHTAVNTTLLRPQTSIVPHDSSVLPVHMYARGIFLHLSMCECAVFFSLYTRRQVILDWIVCVRARALCVNWRGTFFAFYLCARYCEDILFLLSAHIGIQKCDSWFACVICKLVWHVFALCALLRTHTDAWRFIYVYSGTAYSFTSTCNDNLTLDCVRSLCTYRYAVFSSSCRNQSMRILGFMCADVCLCGVILPDP